jgi:hypothetical protein
MAETVQITARGKQAKIRNPWGVSGLTLITLGIYYLFWYYFVNREMSDWGEEHQTDIGQSPGTSVAAITIGGLVIIPPFVSIFRTGQRMQLAQRVGGVHGGSAPLFFFLSIIPIVSLLAPAYLQSELNKVWESQRAAEPVAQELAAPEPPAMEPVVAEPVVAEPLAAEPLAAEPAAPEPAAPELVAPKPPTEPAAP